MDPSPERAVQQRHDTVLVEAVLDMASADARTVMAAEAKVAKHKAKKEAKPLASPPPFDEVIQMVA
jgi:hypothetical protein